jgi:two-component system, NarL family, nitrate/nitrite response regulator NarL
MAPPTATTLDAAPVDLLHAGPRTVRVQLLDHDPLSRHVIERYLLEAGLDVVESVADHRDPRIEHHYGRADVAVICWGNAGCCATPDQLAGTVAAMGAHGVRVVLVASRWTRRLVETAVSTGAHGCLVKSHHLAGLAAAVSAVGEGQCVLSPELFALCLGEGSRAGRSRRGPAAPLAAGPELTPREREVLGLLSRGRSTREAAAALRISPATVKSHVSHALTKLGARNRLEAVLRLSEERADRG